MFVANMWDFGCISLINFAFSSLLQSLKVRFDIMLGAERVFSFAPITESGTGHLVEANMVNVLL